MRKSPQLFLLDSRANVYHQWVERGGPPCGHARNGLYESAVLSTHYRPCSKCYPPIKGTSTNSQSINSINPFFRKHELLSLYYQEYIHMDLSTFDASTFLDATVTEVNIKRPLLPAGRAFIATLGEPKSRVWKGKKDETKSGIAIDIPVEFDVSSLPPDVQKLFQDETGKITMDKVIINDSVMLDTLEGPGGMPIIDNSPGRNVRQKRYREALDLNKPGDNFNWRMVQGRQVLAKIKHEPYNGEIYDGIDAIAKPF
jgi:hypothetical protein